MRGSVILVKNYEGRLDYQTVDHLPPFCFRKPNLSRKSVEV